MSNPSPRRLWLGEPIIIPSFLADFAGRGDHPSSVKTFNWESARPPFRKTRYFIKEEIPDGHFPPETVVHILGKCAKQQTTHCSNCLGAGGKSMKVPAHVPDTEKCGKREGAPH